MLDFFEEIINFILLAFGVEIDLRMIFKYTFIALSGPVLLVLFYAIAWNRARHYSRLMDKYVLELWSKEEFQINEQNISDDVRQMRLERLKREYEEKINKTQKIRDILFKTVPFLKWYYKRKKGENAPMYTLP